MYAFCEFTITCLLAHTTIVFRQYKNQSSNNLFNCNFGFSSFVNMWKLHIIFEQLSEKVTKKNNELDGSSDISTHTTNPLIFVTFSSQYRIYELRMSVFWFSFGDYVSASVCWYISATGTEFKRENTNVSVWCTM